jgi:hypothetical protein
VACKFGLACPFKRRATEGLRLPGIQAAEEESQMDGEVRVIVREALEELAHGHVNAQFLAQFAREALLKSLARVSFAAREFPQPAEMIFGSPLRDQELAVAKDQAGRDLN